MAEDPPHQDDDPFAVIDRIRRQLEAEATRERVDRGSDRRVGDRRGLSFMSRREDDRERSSAIRTFLSSYLCQLPRKELLVWVDGLWLGNASDEHLAMLLESVRRAEEAKRLVGPKKKGRPRETPGPADDSLRAEYRDLQQEFKGFSRARENHFNPSNRRRATGQRLTDFRYVCSQSPIGRRVDAAGLFDRFFEDEGLGPGMMAAMLMHHDLQRQLKDAAASARTQAKAANSVVSRDMARVRAQRLAAELKRFPSWRTLYDKLRHQPSSQHNRSGPRVRQ